MLLLLIRKSGGNLSHGCAFCDAAKPLDQEGMLYRLSDLNNWHLKYEEAGGDKKKQKDFQNVINKPLLEMRKLESCRRQSQLSSYWKVSLCWLPKLSDSSWSPDTRTLSLSSPPPTGSSTGRIPRPLPSLRRFTL